MTAKRKPTSVVTEVTAPSPRGDKSIVRTMAVRYGMDSGAFTQVLMNTVMPSRASKEQVAAFLLICSKYELDPFASEVFAFPDRGGVKALVGVDGYLSIANRNPNFDGLDYEEHKDKDGKLEAITCKVYRKDRSHPVVATEYMSECFNDRSPVWKKMPNRMLRHKATIQAIRLAFGLAGLGDPDEYNSFEHLDQSAKEPVDLNKVVDVTNHSNEENDNDA